MDAGGQEVFWPPGVVGWITTRLHGLTKVLDRGRVATIFARLP